MYKRNGKIQFELNAEVKQALISFIEYSDEIRKKNKSIQACLTPEVFTYQDLIALFSKIEEMDTIVMEANCSFLLNFKKQISNLSENFEDSYEKLSVLEDVNLKHVHHQSSRYELKKQTREIYLLNLENIKKINETLPSLVETFLVLNNPYLEALISRYKTFVKGIERMPFMDSMLFIKLPAAIDPKEPFLAYIKKIHRDLATIRNIYSMERELIAAKRILKPYMTEEIPIDFQMKRKKFYNSRDKDHPLNTLSRQVSNISRFSFFFQKKSNEDEATKEMVQCPNCFQLTDAFLESCSICGYQL